VGIVARAFEGAVADRTFGKPIGAIFGRYAIGAPPEGSTGLNLRVYARAIRMVLAWRLSGRSWPHPFFDRATRAPTRPLTTLSPAAREALRSLCGQRPITPPAPA